MDLASYPATNAFYELWNVLIKMVFKTERWNANSSFVRQWDSLVLKPFILVCRDEDESGIVAGLLYRTAAWTQL